MAWPYIAAGVVALASWACGEDEEGASTSSTDKKKEELEKVPVFKSAVRLPDMHSPRALLGGNDNSCYMVVTSRENGYGTGGPGTVRGKDQLLRVFRDGKTEIYPEELAADPAGFRHYTDGVATEDGTLVLTHGLLGSEHGFVFIKGAPNTIRYVKIHDDPMVTELNGGIPVSYLGNPIVYGGSIYVAAANCPDVSGARCEPNSVAVKMSPEGEFEDLFHLNRQGVRHIEYLHRESDGMDLLIYAEPSTGNLYEFDLGIGATRESSPAIVGVGNSPLQPSANAERDRVMFLQFSANPDLPEVRNMISYDAVSGPNAYAVRQHHVGLYADKEGADPEKNIVMGAALAAGRDFLVQLYEEAPGEMPVASMFHAEYAEEGYQFTPVADTEWQPDGQLNASQPKPYGSQRERGQDYCYYREGEGLEVVFLGNSSDPQ